MNYCLRVIGKQKGQLVFCSGVLVAQTYTEKGKVFRQMVCIRCGKSSSLDPEEVKYPSKKVEEFLSGL